MNCYLLGVKTTNSYPANNTKGSDGEYINCINGRLYVIADSMADAE